MLRWEPPHRLVPLWHLRFDRSDATEVEVTCTPRERGTAVAGELLVQVDGVDVTLGPGEAVRVPAGTPHAYSIASERL